MNEHSVIRQRAYLRAVDWILQRTEESLNLRCTRFVILLEIVSFVDKRR